jgi:hypothetical protein
LRAALEKVGSLKSTESFDHMWGKDPEIKNEALLGYNPNTPSQSPIERDFGIASLKRGFRHRIRPFPKLDSAVIFASYLALQLLSYFADPRSSRRIIFSPLSN